MASKPKPVLAQWLIDQRNAHGESVADVARVADRSEATVRGWEAGRPPQSDAAVIAHLERHWGAIAPVDGPVSGDLAIALGELAEELRLSRESRADLERRLGELERLVSRLTERGFAGAPAPAAPPVTAE